MTKIKTFFANMPWVAIRLSVTVAAAALVGSLATSSQALSDTLDWPQRTVKFIVPLGPGSGVDITARLVASRLTQRWGQPVVIENRPGGDGIVAIGAFVGANDDHTLLFTPTSSFGAHPFLHEKLPYDPQSLLPIVRATATLAGVGVTSSLKVRTVSELVALARAEPGKLNWAGVTGALDFVFGGFLKSAGLNMNKVPYRDGVQAVNDLGEGRIHVFLTAYAIIRPQIEAGKVTLVVLNNQERAPAIPAVQTAREAGYPSLTFDGLVGLFGPRDMAAARRDKIAADVQAVLTEPDMVTQLERNGQLVRPGGAEEFAKAIDVQRSQIAAAAGILGIKANR